LHNDGLVAGLYLNNLDMGVDSLLIISSNVQVYFIGSNTWDSSNFLLEVIRRLIIPSTAFTSWPWFPEPGVIFLWLSGVANGCCGPPPDQDSTIRRAWWRCNLRRKADSD